MNTRAEALQSAGQWDHEGASSRGSGDGHEGPSAAPMGTLLPTRSGSTCGGKRCIASHPLNSWRLQGTSRRKCIHTFPGRMHAVLLTATEIHMKLHAVWTWATQIQRNQSALIPFQVNACNFDSSQCRSGTRHCIHPFPNENACSLGDSHADPAEHSAFDLSDWTACKLDSSRAHSPE